VSESVYTRDSTLHADLLDLVKKHGIGNVRRMVEVIHDDLRAVQTPKRTKYATTYEGHLLRDTGKAVLWWIPPEKGQVHGQATWVPHQLVISALDSCPSDLNELPLGILTTTKPVEWEYVRLIGRSVEWLGRRRRSA
jgi:hypothetical protein